MCGGELRFRIDEQFCEFLCELRWGQDITHLLLLGFGDWLRCEEGWCGNGLVCFGRLGRRVGGECLAAAIAGHDLEFYPHPWGELARITIEYRRMKKDILAAIVRRNEPVSASLIELKYPACRQFVPPLFQPSAFLQILGHWSPSGRKRCTAWRRLNKPRVPRILETTIASAD